MNPLLPLLVLAALFLIACPLGFLAGWANPPRPRFNWRVLVSPKRYFAWLEDSR